MKIRAWVDDGLLYMARDRSTGKTAKVEIQPGVFVDGDVLQPEHAIEVDGNIVWMPHPEGARIAPLLDLEKSQINMGRAWPPRTHASL